MRQAQALIIALFIMMALSLIAWTVVNFSTADLSVGTRLLDSERALYIAEAGAQWAANQASNSSWCAGVSPVTTYKLGNGEYAITCNSANGITVTSTGYIPSKSACDGGNCLGKRVVQQSPGNSAYIDKLVQAYNNFDWSAVQLTPNPYKSYFDGDIAVGNTSSLSYGYEGPGGNINVPNEAGIDYSSNSPVLPPSTLTPAPTRGSKASYPGINPDTLWSNADSFWPNPGNNPTVDQLAAVMDQNLRLCFATFSLGNMCQVNNDLGQSFTATGTYTVNNIKIMFGPNYFKPIPDLSTVTLTICSDTTSGGQHIPNAVLATSVAQTPVPSTWNTFNFTQITLTSGTIYWLVLHDNTTENPESHYSVRAGYSAAISPQGLLFRKRNPDLAWNDNRTTSNRQTDPQLFFQVCQNAAVRAGTDASRVYNRSLPYILGDIGGTEYDCAQSFKIRPWWPSSTITNVITRHLNVVGGAYPTGSITVRIETDNNGVPSGNLVAPNATTTYNAPNPANPTNYTAAFPSPVVLQYDTALKPVTYWIVWDAPNQANSVYYNLAAAGYKYGGVSYRANGGVWAPSRQPDVFFKVTLQTGETPGSGNSGDSVFFTGMNGEILKNYSYDAARSLTGAWNDNEWAFINGNPYAVNYADINFFSPGYGADNKFAVILDRSVDWRDTDEVQLAHYIDLNDDSGPLISPTQPVPQNWYVAAGLVFDCGNNPNNSFSLYNRGFTTERDIGIVGTGGIVLEAPSNANAPVLASEFGNIYSTQPSTTGNPSKEAQRRTVCGLIYTNFGNVTFNDLCAGDSAGGPSCAPAGSSDMGAAILGANVTMANYVYIDSNSTRINKNGKYLTCSGGSCGSSWQEQ